MNRPPPLFAFRGLGRRFATDGCSGYVSWLWGEVLRLRPIFRRCCEEHDHRYQYGIGSRLAADLRLIADMTDVGHERWGAVGAALSFLLAVMFALPIRLFGASWLPFSWRWRYGEDFWNVIGLSKEQ